MDERDCGFNFSVILEIYKVDLMSLEEMMEEVVNSILPLTNINNQ